MALLPSDISTTLFNVVTVAAAGATGAAVPAVVVVIEAGGADKFSDENETGPPAPPESYDLNLQPVLQLQYLANSTNVSASNAHPNCRNS